MLNDVSKLCQVGERVRVAGEELPSLQSHKS
jgi:hypothetical protein